MTPLFPVRLNAICPTCFAIALFLVEGRRYEEAARRGGLIDPALTPCTVSLAFRDVMPPSPTVVTS